jgi:hypothetical protein
MQKVEGSNPFSRKGGSGVGLLPHHPRPGAWSKLAALARLQRLVAVGDLALEISERQPY